MGGTRVTIEGAGTRVKVLGGEARRVTLDERTVARIQDNRPRVIPISPGNPVQVTERATVVKTGGGMGVQGPPGQAGGSVPPIAFAFGDAARTIWSAPAPGTLTVARIKINAVFDGVAPQVALGVAGAPESLFPAAYNDPRQAEEFEFTPDVRLAAGVGVVLTITPSGSTAGAGVVFLTFIPD